MNLDSYIAPTLRYKMTLCQIWFSQINFPLPLIAYVHSSYCRKSFVYSFLFMSLVSKFVNKKFNVLVCVIEFILSFFRCIQCSLLLYLRYKAHWHNGLSVRQWPGKPEFNPRSSHTKDSKKRYFIPPCLTLSIIRYGSRVSGEIQGKE